MRMPYENKNIIEETYMQHAYLNEAENISETEKDSYGL